MIQRYAQIWFFRKGSETSFLPHSVNDFTRKVFLMLYYINWPNFVVFFLLLLKIFDNICFSIACFQACDVINSEIKLVFLVKLFCYMTKKSRQKFKYIENEKSFWGGIKAFSVILKRLWIAKNCLRPGSAPLNHLLVYGLVPWWLTMLPALKYTGLLRNQKS